MDAAFLEFRPICVCAKKFQKSGNVLPVSIFFWKKGQIMKALLQNFS